MASAERSSKLKLIKTYLRSSISQERLDGLALLAIENEGAKQLNIDDLLDKFANTKARDFIILRTCHMFSQVYNLTDFLYNNTRWVVFAILQFMFNKNLHVLN